MPRYIIERDMPGAGGMTPAMRSEGARKSCDVLEKLGPKIQWVKSFVTADKIFCEYIAPDEAMVRKHAELSGFPANRIHKVESTIDPTDSEIGTSDSLKQAA